MSKNILIVVEGHGSPHLKFASRIRSYFKDQNITITVATFEQLVFELSEQQIKVSINEVDITHYNLVYIRKAGTTFATMANSLGICLKYLKVPFFDTVFGEYAAKGNKLRSLVQLFVSGIPVPKTIYYVNLKVVDHYENLSNKLGLPFVAKDIGLQRGKGIFLIKTKDDLTNLPRSEGKFGKSVYLFQQLIEKKHEYRTVIVGNKVGVWYEKIPRNKAEFRYNTSLGAKEVFFNKDETPPAISKPALKSAKALKIEIAGVDIVVEKETDKVYILEVNRGPGLTVYETGSPEYEALAAFLEKEIWQDEKL